MSVVGIIGAGRLGDARGGGERVIFLSGDDADAKSEVRSLFETPASPSSTSAACAQAARCSRSAVRSPM
jgi:hypothetical protein